MGSPYVYMRVRNFNLVAAKADRQTAKLNSPPTFPAIWYKEAYIYSDLLTVHTQTIIKQDCNYRLG